MERCANWSGKRIGISPACGTRTPTFGCREAQHRECTESLTRMLSATEILARDAKRAVAAVAGLVKRQSGMRVGLGASEE